MGFTEKRFNVERFNRLPEEALGEIVEASFKHWKGLGQCEEKTAAEWREYLRNEDREAPRLHFGVSWNSRVVAMASVVEKNYPDSNEEFTPWMANFFVLPEFRGKGLINMLRGQLISALKQLGYTEVYVMAEADSTELHSKAGFVMVEPKQQIMKRALRS
jgi:predicted N-acetyltransferase YhbS